MHIIRSVLCVGHLAAVWRAIWKVGESSGGKVTTQKVNAICQVRKDESSPWGRAVRLSGTRGGEGCKEWFRNRMNTVGPLK